MWKSTFFDKIPKKAYPRVLSSIFFGEASSFYLHRLFIENPKKSVLRGGRCSNLLQRRGFLISALRRKKWCFNNTELFFLTIKFLKLIPRLWIWFFSTEGHVLSSHRHLRTPHNFCKTHWTSHQRFAPPWLHWSFLPAMRLWDLLNPVCIMQGSPLFQFFLSASIFFPVVFILLHLPWSSPHPNPQGLPLSRHNNFFLPKSIFVGKKFFPQQRNLLSRTKRIFLNKVFNENTKETVLLFL